MIFYRNIPLVILCTVFIFLGCQTEKEHKFRYSEYMEEEQPVTVLKVLENDFLSVKIYSNSYTEIEDLINNKKWETWSVAIQDKSEVEVGEVWLRTGRSLTHQYPGRFYGKAEGDNIRFTMIGRQGLIIGTFLIQIELEDSWMIYKILEIDESIPSLVYPPPIKSDAIILPKGVGEIIAFRGLVKIRHLELCL